MAENADAGRLRRRRRRIGQKDDHKGNEDAEVAAHKVHTPAAPVFDFLHLVSFILEWDIPILFPGEARPRNSFAMVGSGGSFLVFSHARTMDEAVIKPYELRSLADKMVLKRTRAHPLHPEASTNNDAVRYASIMAELQVLVYYSVTEHENIIDLLGLTWDFELNSDGTRSVWAVLALEAGECTMESLMYQLKDAPVATKIKYCHDVAKALEFLHERGVVHCDVKLENVLICVTSLSGSVAKLSDFGSALLNVSSETNLPYGAVGTRPWNAPEYGENLTGLDIFKLDVFSYGMLLWRSMACSGILDDLSRSQVGEREKILSNIEEKKRSDQLLRVAVRDVKSTYAEAPELGTLVTQLQCTLTLDPTERSSMAELRASLDDIVAQESDDDDEADDEEGSIYDELKGTVESPNASDCDNHSMSRESQDDDMRILPVPPVPFYNDFELFYERFEDEALVLKQQLIQSLKSCVSRKEQSEFDAAEAAYQLSVCYFNGFGVEENTNGGLKWTLEAATLGSHKARANAYRMSEAVSNMGAVGSSDFQRTISWLKEAASLGSDQALKDLRVLDLGGYAIAQASWRRRFCEINGADGDRIPSESELLILCRGLTAKALDNLVLNNRGHRPIHLAASLGYIQAFRELISRGVCLNTRNAQGETALLCACRAGHAPLTRRLLRLGAKVRGSKSGETPLHWLITFDDADVEEIANKLVAQGAGLEEQHTSTEPNDYTFDIYPQGTPLDWAVSRREMAAIKVLVELGADPYNECSAHSPFIRAVSLHDAEVLQVLLGSIHATPERVKMFDSTGQTLLFHAIYCNQPYQRILQHGADVLNAARNTIRILVDSGCDPSCVDKDGTTIMHLAAGYCDADFIKMLLEDFNISEDINTPCGETVRTPIHHAIASGKLEVVQLLISHGADTLCLSKGKNLLHLCARVEDEPHASVCLKLLLASNRPDLDALAIDRDAPQGLTAFEMAVLGCHLELADILLADGADPADPAGREPHFFGLLISLAAWDSPHALQYYLSKANPPFIVRASTQLSALHISASIVTYQNDSLTGEVKLVLLLKTFPQSSHLNARTTRAPESDVPGGQTPLHYAARFGVYFAVRKLVEAGAWVDPVDDNGRTPLDLAKTELRKMRDRVMPHEMLNMIGEVEDTIAFLEGALKGGPLPALGRRPSIGEYTRTRFSRLGFRTGEPEESGN